MEMEEVRKLKQAFVLEWRFYTGGLPILLTRVKKRKKSLVRRSGIANEFEHPFVRADLGRAMFMEAMATAVARYESALESEKED